LRGGRGLADRPLGNLAYAISEDLEHGESPDPLDLGHEQIEAS
jgi:hypothetical protein